ncbi:26595_t:CDS:2, partial [Gigaspora margarita]
LMAYGKQTGFIWRIENKYPDNNGDSSQQCNRKSVKTECTCFVNICWPLSSPGLKLNLTHYGHALNPDTAAFANVYRQFSQNIMDKIEFYVRAVHGINQQTLRQLLQSEFEDQLFLYKDLANAIQQFRRGDIMNSEQDPENDASNLLQTLRKMRDDDPTWFIAEHCVKNRLYHVFWISPLQQNIYFKHHDVILTDNTAQTNKYRLSLCLFVGVDEHRHSRVIAQALMSDETTSSYMWVLNKLLEATNNVAPITIYSDCDTGLGPAIETVFPNTRYLNCIFHIFQNIKKHLMHSLESQFAEFQNEFFSCRNTLFQEVFESRFELICEFNAGMSSTKRVESINAIVHQRVNSHSTLMEFFNSMQDMLASELQKSKYRDYLDSLPFNIISSSANRVFPRLVESLKSVLTDRMFEIQKAQIDVCFEYYSSIVSSNLYSLCDRLDTDDFSVCLEDTVDMSQVALKSVIERVDLVHIKEVWEVRHMSTNSTSTNYVVLLKDHSHICTCLLLFNNVDALFSHSGVSNETNDVAILGFSEVQVPMGQIRNLRQDNLNENLEINSAITKRQIYGECAALGRKLASLAADFNITHVTATLHGLIQQIEGSNEISTNNANSQTIQNPSKVNPRGRPRKRLQSAIEENSRASHKIIKNSNENYICRTVIIVDIIQEVVLHHAKFAKNMVIHIYIVQTKRTCNLVSLI